MHATRGAAIDGYLFSLVTNLGLLIVRETLA
jgi:hypothetical protein